jgi:hypothetical protein
MQKHLQEQVSIYGEQSLVNLVNQKGYEQPVKEAYERYISQVCCFSQGQNICPSNDAVDRLIFLMSDTNTLISTTSARTCAGIASVYLLIK